MSRLSIFIVTLFIFSSSGSFAQQSLVKKQRTDPAISEHNYKHPNKARAAKQIRENGSETPQVIIATETGTLSEQAKRNYKIPARNKRNYLYKHRDTDAINVIVVETEPVKQEVNQNTEYYKKRSKVNIEID